ncbi:hypothetical protein JCM1841_006847 [Sporobolomyces salmonicolor]
MHRQGVPPSLNLADDPYHDQPTASTSSHRAPTSPRPRPSTSTPTLSPRRQSSSTGYFSPDHDDGRLLSGGRRAMGGLPFYSSGSGAGVGSPGRGWLRGRLRSGRARWMVLAAVLVAVWMWSSGEADSGDLSPAMDGAERTTLGKEVLLAEKTDPLPSEQTPPKEEPTAEPVLPRPVARPPPKPPTPARPAAPGAESAADTRPIDVPVRRSSPSPLVIDPSERFLAYSPHSGYHNQRISLENALTLAFLLKRTLLLPPVWLGHAIPYISFDKLQRRLEMASKTGLERCVPFGDGSPSDPIPRECEGFWDWTLVDWSFLINVDAAEELVPIKRRWNLSTEWMEDELSLRRPNKRGEGGDTWYLKDDTMYQYRFYDSKDDDEPLAKWGNRIDVDELRKDTDSYKLVHVGTLFGTSRLRTTTEPAFDARSAFRKAMVFRNEVVDEVTTQVRDRLGGEGRYYGLHLRVGDGVFQTKARENMRGVWEKLCVEKMKLQEGVCEEVRRASEEKQDLRRRDDYSTLDASSSVPPTPSTSTTTPPVKRANSRPQREGAYHHAPLPPLPVIQTLSDSPLSPLLTCRRPLHTSPQLLPFNAPLYIATDSKLPRSDPNLAIFFDAFPCAFTLSDFADVEALRRMERLRNEEDKTPLAQFLYPQLDAQIAAWGRGLVGTPQSTYSRFAIDVLHQVYHGWEIVERG